MWEECPKGPSAGLGAFSCSWGGETYRDGSRAARRQRVQAGSLRGVTRVRASITGGSLEEAAREPPAENGGGWPGAVRPSKAVWRAFGSPSCGLRPGWGVARAEGPEGRAEGSQGTRDAHRQRWEVLWSGGRELESWTRCPLLGRLPPAKGSLRRRRVRPRALGGEAAWPWARGLQPSLLGLHAGPGPRQGPGDAGSAGATSSRFIRGQSEAAFLLPGHPSSQAPCRGLWGPRGTPSGTPSRPPIPAPLPGGCRNALQGSPGLC